MSLRGIARFAWRLVAGGLSMLKVGDAAPDFEATDHRGQTVKLGDYRGKKLVLWFYPKASTGG